MCFYHTRGGNGNYFTSSDPHHDVSIINLLSCRSGQRTVKHSDSRSNSVFVIVLLVVYCVGVCGCGLCLRVALLVVYYVL